LLAGGGGTAKTPLNNVIQKATAEQLEIDLRALNIDGTPDLVLDDIATIKKGIAEVHKLRG
jgi:hypothetical protein